MGHLKIARLRLVFKIQGGKEHERKSRETRPRAVNNLVPRAFPLKNGWGPTYFLREKPWGRVRAVNN